MKLRSTVLVLLFFALTTVVLTWPVTSELSERVYDLGDPLLNIWILGWNLENWLLDDLGSYVDGRLFQANLFYPHQRTLAFSEVLIPQTLVAALPYLLTGNLTLAYNIVLLFSILFTAFSMFLLAFHLTRSTTAALLSGLIFGFSPFMLDHLMHLQVLFAAGFPLTFLFLFRFLENERVGDLIGLALSVSMQALANGYYAVFLFYALIGAVAYHLLASLFANRFQGWPDRQLLLRRGAHLTLFCLLMVALCLPVFSQYYAFKQETSFKRHSSAEARIESYLSVPTSNLLRGHETRNEFMHERRLYPGVLPVVLAILLGVLVWCRGIGRPGSGWRGRGREIFRWTVLLIVLWLFGTAALGERLGEAFDLSTPFLSLGGLLLLGAMLDRRLRLAIFQPLTTVRGRVQFFVLLLLTTFAISFGFAGPYRHLFWNVPGFDAVRAIPRIHVLTMFCLAALTSICWRILGFRLRMLSARRSRGWALALTAMAAAVLLVEYASRPSPGQPVPTVTPLPEVYAWLAEQAPSPVLELPLAMGYRTSCQRVYYSAFHGQPLLNGFSGYLPPFYRELRRRWRRLPPVQTFDDARRLGARYVILHHAEMSKRERVALERSADALAKMSRRVAIFGTDEVLELLPSDKMAVTWIDGGDSTSTTWSSGQVVDRSGSVVEALMDDDPNTIWTSGAPQEGGERLVIEFKQEVSLRGLDLSGAGDALDFPRGLSIDQSLDGLTWQRLHEDANVLPPIKRFLPPTDLTLRFRWPPPVPRRWPLPRRGVRSGRGYFPSRSSDCGGRDSDTRRVRSGAESASAHLSV